jgi:hypothetical protein
MLSERLFEDILVKYTKLIENNLTFIGRQVNYFGKRIDILLEDRFKEKLIVELKIGNLQSNALSQVMEYEGYILSEKDPSARVMIIANRIPLNLKKAMDHHGIEYKEITMNHIMKFLEEKDEELYKAMLAQRQDEPQLDPTKTGKWTNRINSSNYGLSEGKRITKKSVCLEYISREGGGSIKEMAKAIVDRGIDPDYEKNIRVCRLWMSKIGVPVLKLQNGNYIKSIHL